MKEPGTLDLGQETQQEAGGGGGGGGEQETSNRDEDTECYGGLQVRAGGWGEEKLKEESKGRQLSFVYFAKQSDCRLQTKVQKTGHIINKVHSKYAQNCKFVFCNTK